MPTRPNALMIPSAVEGISLARRATASTWVMRTLTMMIWVSATTVNSTSRRISESHFAMSATSISVVSARRPNGDVQTFFRKPRSGVRAVPPRLPQWCPLFPGTLWSFFLVFSVTFVSSDLTWRRVRVDPVASGRQVRVQPFTPAPTERRCGSTASEVVADLSTRRPDPKGDFLFRNHHLLLRIHDFLLRSHNLLPLY